MDNSNFDRNRTWLDRATTTFSRMATSKWAPFIVAAAAILTRSWAVYLTRGRADLADDKDQVYFMVAKNFLATGNLSYSQQGFGEMHSWLPPGMAFLYIGYMWIFGPDMSYLRFFFIAMSVAANVCLIHVGRRLYEPVYAFLAALLWALYPPQWFWASRSNPNTVATNMVIFCLLLLFIAWEKRSFLGAFAVGVLWVTVTLNRGEYVLGIMVLAFASLFAFDRRRVGLGFASILILGWVAGFAPWVARNYHVHHRFVWIATNDGDNFWKSYNPAYNFSGNDIPFPPELNERLVATHNEVERSDILKAEAKKFIREHPERALRNVGGNLLNFWRPWLSPEAVSWKENAVYVLSYGPLFILFVCGVYLMPKKNPYWIAVGGLILYKWLIHSLFYVIVRFREALMPLLGLIAVLPIRTWQKGDDRG